MANINSSQYKNLFFTYLLSNRLSKGTIILLDGLPSNPLSKEELIKKLMKKNYDVFFPRYEGTWESKGEFLKRVPSETVIEFINALRKGLKIGDKKYNATKIFILGASFGGGVALDIANKNVADKICVASPVTSFRKVEGIDTLENFLKTAQGNNYRFDSKNWKKLLNDRIWNLDNDEIRKPSDILIIFGNRDDQIKDGDIIEFGKKHRIKVHSYEFGHITLSKITELMLEEIINFFSK